MPIVIRTASSTEELNDALALRFEILSGVRREIEGSARLSRRVVDAIDISPETVNLVAYSEGGPCAAVRFAQVLAAEALQQQRFCWADTAKQFQGDCYLIDWVGCRNVPSDEHRALSFELIDFGCLGLARAGVKAVFFACPDAWREQWAEMGAYPVMDPKEIGGLGLLHPMAMDIPNWYAKWTSGIKDQELLRFQDLFYKVIFQKDEIILTQGELGSSAYLIQEGAVEVIIENDEFVTIGELGAQQLIGEIGMITQEARTASLVAKSRVSAFAFDRQAFLEVLDREPHVAMDIFKIFSKRINEANRKMSGAPHASGDSP